MIVVWVLFFVFALALLIFSAEKFTTAAEKLGLHFGISPFIVGITIVSIGTSLPELAAGIIAASQQSTGIVVGNVVGSNISNLFLVLGVSALIATRKKSIKFQLDFAGVDMPLFISSVFLLTFAVWNGIFSLGEAILFFIAYVLYIMYSINIGTHAEHKETIMIEKNIPKKYQKKGFPARSLVVVIISGIFIYLGASLTVDSILELSKQLNIGSEIIALTAVALGTSLPELSVAIAAARKGSFEMALGDVLGSNVFNTFMVMAIPTFVNDLLIPKSFLQFHIPLMIGGSVLVFLMLLDRKMTRTKGIFLILFYALFIFQMFL